MRRDKSRLKTYMTSATEKVLSSVQEVSLGHRSLPLRPTVWHSNAAVISACFESLLDLLSALLILRGSGCRVLEAGDAYRLTVQRSRLKECFFTPFHKRIGTGSDWLETRSSSVPVGRFRSSWHARARRSNHNVGALQG